MIKISVKGKKEFQRKYLDLGYFLFPEQMKRSFGQLKTYIRKKNCFPTKFVKACAYKFLRDTIIQHVEDNP